MPSIRVEKTSLKRWLLSSSLFITLKTHSGNGRSAVSVSSKETKKLEISNEFPNRIYNKD